MRSAMKNGQTCFSLRKFLAISSAILAKIASDCSCDAVVHLDWELIRELRLSYCSSREMPFREWNFVFGESHSQFQELLREYPGTLDGRNRARVIAESLARIIAAIRITSVRWQSYLPLKTQHLVLP